MAAPLKGSFPANASKALPTCWPPAKRSKNNRLIQTASGTAACEYSYRACCRCFYEIRNNRGVGHVGGDVDPNHMDAEAVQTMAGWAMAELVRIFHGVKTEEAQETVDALVERKSPIIWEVLGKETRAGCQDDREEPGSRVCCITAPDGCRRI